MNVVNDKLSPSPIIETNSNAEMTRGNLENVMVCSVWEKRTV
jgi:hypothetical protein